MKPTRLSRLLVLMTALRRCAAAILRHARMLSLLDVRREHALAEYARIKGDLLGLRAQTGRMLMGLMH